ncbi:DUF4123 domain-containing protein [Comamonas sp. Y33R10-2]|uniref:DUF4123 domain-containing protein n=1 Tax=Comamonas sp. Y33R10-2 TaxID=2853257 RepID=UPI001C5C8EB2|nr:DUF4123 domain-containing protein [Comamonas sp. Y33R10-2]QXZ11202.1 DUF4123 domain-containing protein [Comamonas sp. Y33R10-2]
MSKVQTWHEMKPARQTWPQRWSQIKSSGKFSDKPLQLYLLLDAAQKRDLLALVPESGAEALFAFTRSTKEGKVSPWLVHLGRHGQSLKKPQQDLLNAVLDVVQASPCATLLASECEMAVLIAHLRRAMDPKMPDKDSSYLAFWDPAVLAVLLGQRDLDTQSRIEPVLKSAQSRALLGPIARWWCWSRSGRLHEYAVSDFTELSASMSMPLPLPLQLSAAQVEALVQGNVPDLLIYFVNLNQVHLRDKLPPLAMHWFVRQQLVFARRYGLTGTRDLLNYLCLALIGGARVDQIPEVAELLAKVKARKLSFDNFMDEVAPKLDGKDLAEPQVLMAANGLPLTENQLPR